MTDSIPASAANMPEKFSVRNVDGLVVTLERERDGDYKITAEGHDADYVSERTAYMAWQSLPIVK